jgi:excisionase family DNA binding protein
MGRAAIAASGIATDLRARETAVFQDGIPEWRLNPQFMIISMNAAMEALWTIPGIDRQVGKRSVFSIYPENFARISYADKENHRFYYEKAYTVFYRGLHKFDKSAQEFIDAMEAIPSLRDIVAKARAAADRRKSEGPLRNEWVYTIRITPPALGLPDPTSLAGAPQLPSFQGKQIARAEMLRFYVLVTQPTSDEDLLVRYQPANKAARVWVAEQRVGRTACATGAVAEVLSALAAPTPIFYWDEDNEFDPESLKAALTYDVEEVSHPCYDNGWEWNMHLADSDRLVTIGLFPDRRIARLRFIDPFLEPQTRIYPMQQVEIRREDDDTVTYLSGQREDLQIRVTIHCNGYIKDEQQPVPAASQPPRLTTKEAAEILACDPANVKYLIHAGYLPAAKVGGQWSIDAAAVAAYKGRRRRRQA